MPIINAGASTAVTVAVGTYLEGTGAGTAILGRAAVVEPLTAGDAWQIGPFDVATSVSLSAFTALTYDAKDVMQDPSAADKFSRATSAALQSLVSGAGIPANTVYVCGDSMNTDTIVTPDSVFTARGTESAFNYFDALMGAPFDLLGSLAVGGKTTRQMIDEQFSVIDALPVKPRYIDFTCGYNDVFIDGASAATTYSRIVEAVNWCLSRGIVPIWTTVWWGVYSPTLTPIWTQLNDMLRQFARRNNCGLFWDGESIVNEPTIANKQGRTPLASYFYDSTTHPNNLLALHLGQYKVQQLAAYFQRQNFSAVGNEDLTLSGGTSNLLLNPGFIASGAASGTGITGTLPTSWVADWVTRTGTGSAACAIVSITDPATGLQIANAIQMTISGAANAGDILRLSQTEVQNPALASSLVGGAAGSVVQSEATISIASGANITQCAHRLLVNNADSSWDGQNQKTAVALPATVPALTRRTRPRSINAAGVATNARHDLRVTFNGAGTGSVITMWRPRFRKIS